ncbi:PREDICTED: glioma tumor suppressor candidate region gene 2 protein-like [Rhagoletis zephyria]|uniref:glioma tumor suppressor candidate region gene 2 protein-like n=1 Tax=Rhagoletis zephyria TaxID=28612 RepID=UPI00081167CC|nr:PREDICTED: glioma tumor suppressor candidate region gene 2 protein-like [Rhagoletis zephyria]
MTTTSSLPSGVAKKRKLKVSRNKKKSWRKHTDIKEIEDFLENKRFEERVGVAAAEVKDEDLFMIEKTGDDKAYQEKLETMQKRQEAISVESSRLRGLSNGYKLYGKLESSSNVPAVRSKEAPRDRRKTVHNDPLKLEKLWTDKQANITAARKAKTAKAAAYADPKKNFKTFDLWDEGNSKPNSELTREDVLVHPPPKLKVPARLRNKPSLLPAVEVPVGGQSYNPHRDDHKQLILEAANKEMEKINEENKWAKKVDKYFVSKQQAAINNKELIDEMSQGLGLGDNEDEEAGKMTTAEDLAEIAQFAKLVKGSEKKTKQQRRREALARQEKKAKEAEKKLKQKENEIFRLKTFKKELNERDRRMARRSEMRAQRHIESLYKPKKLSKYKFEESEIPLNLPGEVSGSLRTVKAQGNLLEDRFKSLQKRNIIEPRVPQKLKRKFKLKKEVKRRHKDGADGLIVETEKA